MLRSAAVVVLNQCTIVAQRRKNCFRAQLSIVSDAVVGHAVAVNWRQARTMDAGQTLPTSNCDSRHVLPNARHGRQW